MVGLDLDEWQEYALEVAMAERADGRWAAFEFGFCVPRQNGKTQMCVARMLAGLFLLGERLQVYSAHQFKTAKDTYDSLRLVIDTNPQLAAKVAKMPDAHGEQGVYFKGERKPRLLITARGKSAIRGFSADTVYFDEAMDLPETAVSAMMPTLSRRPNGQIWYLGSAVDQEVMEHGEVFARKRQAALSHTTGRLAYLEYSVEGTIEDHDPRDTAQALAANPALDLRDSWTLADVEDERDGMSRRGYAVERLGIGDWPEPEEARDSTVPQGTWRPLALPAASQIVSSVVFAVDVSPDRRHASIAVAGATDEGRLQVEVVADGDGTTWVPGMLAELVLQWDPLAVVIDRASAAASLQASLVAEGIEPTMTGSPEMGQACGGFYDDAMGGVLGHLDDAVLNDALMDADTRRLGDAWAWNRRGRGQITPLVAVTLAHYGFTKFYRPMKGSGPGPSRERRAERHQPSTEDLASTGF